MPSAINVSDTKNVGNKLPPEFCCFCGGTHFWKHGHYYRTGFYRTESQNPPPLKEVLRYLCKSTGCGRTFSDLPEGILPYCRFFLEDFHLLYEKSLKGGSAWSLFKACHLVEVSLKTIQRLLCLFKKVLVLVQKWCRILDGTVTENLAKLCPILVQNYTWFGFTSRWYHALYPARLWEIQNPLNL